jgi:hypothetical protein
MALAGVAVTAAVVVTWQQLETDRRQLRQQLEVADRRTELAGFDWRGAGARMVESC